MQPRVRDHRPTWKLNATHDGVAANYYPVTAAMEIKEEGRAVLSVAVDRAQGAAHTVFVPSTEFCVVNIVSMLSDSMPETVPLLLDQG